MSLGLSRKELCDVVGGEASPFEGKLAFRGVEFDSREIKGGELFVALKGEKSHGHQFLQQAFDRGAALFMVEDKALLDSFPEPERLIIVKDSLLAFQNLAAWWRRERGIPVLAVTGSVGKTTTKEIAASILLKKSQGVYSQKSHNNHVGVPYTLCKMSREHEWAVIEMGMNHAGEISALSKIARPDVALITQIAPAHIEFFKDINAIADAKLEIVDGLPKTGALIWNSDDDVLKEGVRRSPQAAKIKSLTFGKTEGVDIRVREIHAEAFDGISFVLQGLGPDLPISMNILGKHNAVNAAGAVLAARTLIPSITPEEIKSGLEGFKAPLMRLNLISLAEDVRIIDDSYNANPASVASSLDLLADLKSEGLVCGLLLGDMKELGDKASLLHQEIGVKAAGLDPAFFVAVGEYAEALLAESRAKGIDCVAAETPEAAAQAILGREYNVLLVKASRGVGLDRAVKALIGGVGA